MKLRFIPKLNTQEVFEAQNLTHELWGEGLSLESRVEKLHSLLNFAGGNILSMCGLADQKGELVSSMKRYSLTLQCQNEVLPTVGMGAIFTPEKHRRKGYAKQLINAVLEDARQSGVKAAILFSDIGPSYYKGFGFVELNSQNFVILTSDLPSDPVSLQYREANMGEIPKLNSFFKRIFGTHCVRYARDPQVWSFFRDRNGPVCDYIVCREGQDIGFICVTHAGDELYLNEFFVPKAEEEALLILLKELAQKAKASYISGWESYQTLDTVKKCFERAKAIPMIASLDPKLSFDLGKENSWFGALDQF